MDPSQATLQMTPAQRLAQALQQAQAPGVAAPQMPQSQAFVPPAQTPMPQSQPIVPQIPQSQGSMVGGHYAPPTAMQYAAPAIGQIMASIAKQRQMQPPGYGQTLPGNNPTNLPTDPNGQLALGQ